MTIELERSVLGGFMLLGDDAGETLGLIDSDFAQPKHGRIWEAIAQLIEEGDPVDEITVLQRLGVDAKKVGGTPYLSDLVDKTPSAANLTHYAKQLRAVGGRQRFHNALTGALVRARDGDAVADIEGDLSAQLLDVGAEDRQHWADAKTIVKEGFRAVERRYEGHTGLKLGFDDLDHALGGLEPGSLNVLAARPSMGKTALAMQALQHVARNGRALMFSLEMNVESLGMRMVCCDARVDLARARAGMCKESDWPKLANSAGTISLLDMHVNQCSKLSAREVEWAIKQHQKRADVMICVVDYLQLMSGKGANRNEVVSEITRQLKGAATATGVPIVALAQLNRELEKRKDKRPMLSDLRESGSIEQDADTVFFIYRDSYYDNDCKDPYSAEVIIGKNRFGATGTVHLRWFGEYTRFENYKQHGS